MGWSFLGIFTIVALVFSAVGFYKYVYFLSIGYGFSVAAIGVTLMIMQITGYLPLSWPIFILCALFLIYGIRLSGFLLVREIKNARYRQTLKEATGGDKKIPIFVSISIWICVAILYVAQTSPVFFRLYNGGETSALVWVGIGISACAIILESIADKQKSAQKKVRPDMVATKGLYKIVRCPNYFAEILFWTGIFVSGIDTYATIGQWITAAVAYVCIVYIMFNGAQRLEKRQLKRYGDNEEYKAYANKTPIIIPLLPIYHLNKEAKK